MDTECGGPRQRVATDKNPQILGVGPRVAVFLRRTHPRHCAELVARDLRTSPKTVERWLAGHAPTVAHLEGMVALWGERFVATVFWEAFERRDRRIAMLEAKLARLRADAAPAHAVTRTPDDKPDRLYSLAKDSIEAVLASDLSTLLLELAAEIDPLAYMPEPIVHLAQRPVWWRRLGWLTRRGVDRSIGPRRP